MTKTEKRMKEIIAKNSSQYVEGMWVTDLVEGIITAKKEDEFVLDFRETGFRKRGDIFSKSDIAPYFSDLYLQMLPARFDMILRVCGSMFIRQLNELNFDGQIATIDVKHGISVDVDLPVSCPQIRLRSYGHKGTEPISEKVFQNITEILAENLDLLTDTFLQELKGIAQLTPDVSETVPNIFNIH